MTAMKEVVVMGRFRSETGQTTAEYALVILAAAALAVALIAWANGGGLTAFFSAVLGKLMSMVGAG